MRKLLGAVLALGMLLTGFMGVAAQDAAVSSYVTGLNSPATWVDERGNAVATIEVNEINGEWSDHSEYSAPENGQAFTAVTFTVTNISGSSLIVEPYDFSLVDELGRNNGRSWVSLSDEAEGTLFEEDTPVAADESVELTLVYQLQEGIAPSVFVWQPDSGVLVMANIGAANDAVATGFDAPSTWIDESGNPVATFEVTGIDEDWQDFAEYYEPDRGMVYRAVQVKITNVSGASIIIEPYDFTMLDSTGMNNSRSWADASEGSNVQILSDDTPLGDGEAFEGIIVFQMYPDITPTAMLWQPDSGLLNMVVVAEGAEAPAADATPAVEDDVDATPAADDSASVVASGGETEVNSEPVAFEDVIGDEQGTISVVSTLDGWDGYHVNANSPLPGTRFFLVTVDITITAENDFPVSPLDFSVVSESGGTFESDLYLNADDAEVQITESGSQLPAGETSTLVIPFMVPEGETPVTLVWNTGADEVEISLVP